MNYSAFDRELLAVVAAIHHFRYMLEGRSFVSFTDHKPLVGALRHIYKILIYIHIFAAL